MGSEPNPLPALGPAGACVFPLDLGVLTPCTREPPSLGAGTGGDGPEGLLNPRVKGWPGGKVSVQVGLLFKNKDPRW